MAAIQFASTAAISFRLVSLEVPCPHAAQHGHLWQRRCVRRRICPIQCVQQHEAIRPNLDGVSVAFGTSLGQAHVLDPAVVAFVPIRGRDGAQPIGRDNGNGVQRRPQRLAHQFQPVQVSHGGEHVRAVRAAPATGLQESVLARRVQQAGQQTLRGLTLEQPGAELAQD